MISAFPLISLGSCETIRDTRRLATIFSCVVIFSGCLWRNTYKKLSGVNKAGASHAEIGLLLRIDSKVSDEQLRPFLTWEFLLPGL